MNEKRDITVEPRDIKEIKGYFILFLDFIYLFDRERSQVDREAGRERGGKQAPRRAGSPMWGLIPGP